MRKSLLACAVLGAALLVTPSQAGALDQVPQVTVQFSDLNMARSDGAQTLLGRLQAAARQVCGYQAVEFKSIKALTRYRACYSNAMDTAVIHVDNAILAELYGKPMLVAAKHDDTAVASRDARVVISSR